jgi:hypothetical protein
MIMTSDEIGKGVEGDISPSAPLARLILVAYVEPKIFFLEFLAENSPVQPLITYIADWKKIGENRQRLTALNNACESEGRIY